MEFDDFLKIVRTLTDGKSIRAYLDYEYCQHVRENLLSAEMVANGEGKSTIAIVEDDGMLVPTCIVEDGDNMSLVRGKPHDFSAFVEAERVNVENSLSGFTKLENGDYEDQGVKFRIVTVKEMSDGIVKTCGTLVERIEAFVAKKQELPPLRRLNKEEWMAVSEVQREVNIRMFSSMMTNLLGDEAAVAAAKAATDMVDSGVAVVVVPTDGDAPAANVDKPTLH